MPAIASMRAKSRCDVQRHPFPFPAKPHLGCTGYCQRRRALRAASLSVVLLASLAQCAMMVPAAAQTTITQPTGSVLSPVEAIIAEASARFAIPPPWIRAVIHVESGGNANAVSPKGAIGLMQIMPDTWADLARRYGLGADPMSAHDNIIGGTAYLRELYDRFGPIGFLAAYNAGPARYQRYLSDGIPLADETRRYLAQLATALPDLHDPLLTAVPPLSDWRSTALFAALPVDTAPVDLTQSVTPFAGRPRAGQNGLVLRLTPHAAGLFAPISSGSEH